MSTDRNAALVAHIAAQAKSNLEFLLYHKYIPAADARPLLNRLNELEDEDGILALSQQAQSWTLDAAQNANSRRSPSPRPVSTASRSLNQQTLARAIWGYNEDGGEGNDLSFRAGDTIEIVSETNVDWWTGRLHGKTGLFPSNYVEKIQRGASPAPAPVPPPTRNNPVRAIPPPQHPPPGPGLNNYGTRAFAPPIYTPPPQPYQTPPPIQYGPPPQPYQAPPPVQYAPPPTVVYAAAPQAPPPQQSTKSRLGGQLASAAVGGLGFGAGAAIGGDIINSIF